MSRRAPRRGAGGGWSESCIPATPAAATPTPGLTGLFRRGFRIAKLFPGRCSSAYLQLVRLLQGPVPDNAARTEQRHRQVDAARNASAAERGFVGGSWMVSRDWIARGPSDLIIEGVAARPRSPAADSRQRGQPGSRAS